MSGGVDSIAVTYWKRPSIALTIDYGQSPGSAEIRAASAVCSALSIQHQVIHIDCSDLGSGDLSNKPPLEAAPMSEWWPFRNQLLVTLAAMKGISLGIADLLIGSVKTDGVHADGSSKFIEKINDLVSMQEGEMRVIAPAIDLTTVELIRRSKVTVELLSWAHSCHKGNYACGICRGCAKHYSTMAELGYEPY
ncbi:MAG: 7-cyano-7-deazaguanine synthase [Candidatus Acidiferrales bacterium]